MKIEGCVFLNKIKLKNPIHKNQGWELIDQKNKANENTSRHNPKKKQKQTINQNQVRILIQKGLIITK